ncbi:MAG TPA: MBOAT family O-acyltransferase [Fimbriiglobus sp.]|jgi:alginate O-acetyltransferase complex protein AlgI
MLFADAPLLQPGQPATVTHHAAYFEWLHSVLPQPLFHTQAFLCFFLIIFSAYWIIPRQWKNLRVGLLVAASFHFYAAWNYELAFLVTGTTIIDYLLARIMDGTENRRGRIGLLVSSIAMNLGVLCYFKYRGFFVNELHDALTSLGYSAGFDKLTALDVIVPFGISFYTFEAISYAVDVFKRKIPAEKSLPHFLLFILFFPHLVAGPIVRGGDFLRQAHRVKRWNWVRVQVGVQLFLLGLFKKLAIADRMAVFSDPVLQHPGAYNSSAVWLATLAYAFRIYADFSGYSDMAVGTAHLFGYKLVQNFNMPYLSANVTEFWRRWHISLSTWLRDYLFIPLGGSRGTPRQTNRNLMVTMALGGLWHGASWGYLVWGLLHGVYLIVHKKFHAFASRKPELDAALQTPLGTAGRVLFTFFSVTVAWVFFRPDVANALVILKKMFLPELVGKTLPLHNRSLWYTVLFVLACHVVVARGWWQRAWPRVPAELAGVGYATCLIVSLVLAPDTEQTFIYFVF